MDGGDNGGYDGGTTGDGATPFATRRRETWAVRPATDTPGSGGPTPPKGPRGGRRAAARPTRRRTPPRFDRSPRTSSPGHRPRGPHSQLGRRCVAQPATRRLPGCAHAGTRRAGPWTGRRHPRARPGGGHPGLAASAPAGATPAANAGRRASGCRLPRRPAWTPGTSPRPWGGRPCHDHPHHRRHCGGRSPDADRRRSRPPGHRPKAGCHRHGRDLTRTREPPSGDDRRTRIGAHHHHDGQAETNSRVRRPNGRRQNAHRRRHLQPTGPRRHRGVCRANPGTRHQTVRRRRATRGPNRRYGCRGRTPTRSHPLFSGRQHRCRATNSSNWYRRRRRLPTGPIRRRGCDSVNLATRHRADRRRHATRGLNHRDGRRSAGHDVRRPRTYLKLSGSLHPAPRRRPQGRDAGGRWPPVVG